jgi:hypothetical protein
MASALSLSAASPNSQGTDVRAKFNAMGGDLEAAQKLVKQLEDDSQDVPTWLSKMLPTGYETMSDRLTGGPDSFGYTWADSDQAGGPAFSWVDITTIGTNLAITGDDVLSAAVTLPFNFPFYGTNQTTLKACTNGHIQFGTGTSTAYSNAAIPSTGVPNNALYPFWDDMASGTGTGCAGAAVYYYNDTANNRVIVEWYNMRRSGCGTTNNYTLEAILYPNGNIVYQYLTLVGTVNSATIGIENGTGTVALQAHLNGTGWPLAVNKAIRFSYPAGDHTGPTIAHTPLTDTESAGPWTVNATITDDSGVTGATLFYNQNGGTYTSVAMSNVGSLYSAVIPDFLGTMSYYITSADGVSPPNGSTSSTWTFTRRPYSGGPDTFGYTWANSHAPGGPAYSWVDINLDPAAVALTPGDDTYSASIPMSFGFPYYDAVKTSLRVSSNGFITFGASTTNGYGQILPTAAEPNDVIAAFWDDMNSASTTAPGYIKYLDDTANGRFIIQWHTVAYSGSVFFDFQIILHANGGITMNYLDVNEADVALCTQGIENSLGTVGLQVRRNNAGSALTDAFTIAFTRPVGDVVGPAIVHTPLGMTEDTASPYVVTANVSDAESLVAGATLYYQVNGGGYSSVPMTLGVAPAYSASIPAQGPGSAVMYYIVATDNAVPANSTTSSTWTFHVVDYTIAPTGFTASDGVLDAVNLSWTAPAWVVALLGESTPEPQFESFLPQYATKDAAFAAYSAAHAAWLATQGSERSFLNYNIYRDGSLLATSTTTSYTDVPATTAVHSYHVAAQFSSRESNPSNTDTGFKGVRPTSGGPDASGYTWVNNLDVAGPAVDWVDISATGTALTLADDSYSAALPLGFNFPYYGAVKTDVFVGSNGFLSFGAGSTALTNQVLPSTSTPNDVIAGFWDDMNPSLAGSAVYYLSDVANSRFIVQYHVPAYGAISPYTFFDFQVILYTDGNIYVNLSNVDEADVSSATLGIENSAGTVGLSANADNTGGRLADGMTYFFAAPAGDWAGPSIAHTPLTNTEDSTNPYTVNANVSDDDSAVASATLYYRVNAGTYLAVPMIAGVAPAYSAAIPAQAGGSAIQYYIVAVDNSVNNNSTTSPTWSFNVVDYTLAPTALTATDGTSYDGVALAWTAPAWAVAMSTPEPRFEDFLPLHATKQAAWNAFSAAHAAWQSADRSFITYNVYRDGSLVGTSATTSYLDVPAVGTTFTYHVTAQFTAGESNSSNTDTGYFTARPTSGGPDIFGYRWVNSLDPSGAISYEWNDISSNPSAISYTLFDDDAELVALPFQFPFYGVDHDSIYVGSNGVIGMGASVTDYLNDPIPTAGAPDNFIAPFWEDMNPSTGGTVHSLVDAMNGTVTLQWTGIFRFGTSTLPFTFQAVLSSNGSIRYNYQDMQGLRNGATVGIENAVATDGLQVNYDDLGGSLASGVSVRIRSFVPCDTATNVHVTMLSGNATIHWDAVAGTASYNVYVSGDGYGTYTLLGNTTGTSFVHTGAQSLGKQFYKVVSVCN